MDQNVEHKEVFSKWYTTNELIYQAKGKENYKPPCHSPTTLVPPPFHKTRVTLIRSHVHSSLYFAQFVPFFWIFSFITTCLKYLLFQVNFNVKFTALELPCPALERWRLFSRRIQLLMCHLSQQTATMTATAFITSFFCLHWTMNLDSGWLLSEGCLCREPSVWLRGCWGIAEPW